MEREKCVDDDARGKICVNGKLCNTKEIEKRIEDRGKERRNWQNLRSSVGRRTVANSCERYLATGLDTSNILFCL